MSKYYLIIGFLLIAFGRYVLGAEQRATGEFIKVDWGDYQHLTIKIDGKEKSFWCYESKMRNLDCSDLEDEPKKYLGKKIEISYETEENLSPATGKKVQQHVVKEITLVE